MTTLGAFGFTPKRKGGRLAVSSKVIGKEPLTAFIQPTDIIQTKKTLENYFKPKKQKKVEEEEKEVPIVIRKKICLFNIWHQVEQDSIIDEFKETFSTKRRRISRDGNDYIKRQKTFEQDLSYAIRYLNIHQIHNNNNTNVRYKMNHQQSNMFISNMTQEFLH